MKRKFISKISALIAEEDIYTNLVVFASWLSVAYPF